uniref:Uncharacterized protein n=1 Tax=Anguilla anguilla TaxID=7936 RepID=A0A0E9RPV0_ANGAN
MIIYCWLFLFIVTPPQCGDLTFYF